MLRRRRCVDAGALLPVRPLPYICALLVAPRPEREREGETEGGGEEEEDGGGNLEGG